MPKYFKDGIITGLLLFILLTIKQLIFNSEINWIDNTGISIFLIIGLIFWEWVKKPYKYNGDEE